LRAAIDLIKMNREGIEERRTKVVSEARVQAMLAEIPEDFPSD
jgi:hypothetical protein